MKRVRVKLNYDSETDVAYVSLSRGRVIESEEVEPGLIVDFNEKEQVIGVEILRFAERFQRRVKSRRKLAS